MNGAIFVRNRIYFVDSPLSSLFPTFLLKVWSWSVHHMDAFTTKPYIFIFFSIRGASGCATC